MEDHFWSIEKMYSQNSITSKIIFKNDVKTNAFSNKEKLKQFFISIPVQQEIITERKRWWGKIGFSGVNEKDSK